MTKQDLKRMRIGAWNISFLINDNKERLTQDTIFIILLGFALDASALNSVVFRDNEPEGT